MKLLLCTQCSDVFSLVKEKRYCSCKKTWGHYTNDDLTAIVSDSEHAMPLAFHNDSLVSAIKGRPLRGMGSDFRAWVIPTICPTVKIDVKKN